MKGIIILWLALILVVRVNAQDTLVFTNHEKKVIKLLEINPTEVKYKKNNYEDGPTFTVSKAEIHKLVYANGEEDIFNPLEIKPVISSYAIEDGTRIQVELLSTISSKNMREGQVVPFATTEEVYIGDQLVIRKGTAVEGVVVYAEEADFIGQEGKLEIRVERVMDIDGNDIPLTGYIFREGENKTTEAVLLGAFIFWPILFLKGEEAEIPEGTNFYVEVGYALPPE